MTEPLIDQVRKVLSVCETMVPPGKSLKVDVMREYVRLHDLINNPVVDDWLAGARLEAAHQQERYGAKGDAGKTPMDWFWLLGYLGSKIVASLAKGDIDKAKHHTISCSAALLNWHRAISNDPAATMRPGIEKPKGEEG